MSTQVKTETPTTPEDKFFGITTSIDDMIPKEDEEKKETEVIVEHVDEGEGGIVEATATPQEPAKKTEAGASDEDVKDYSEKVQKRIDKLTWQYNEEKRERAKSDAIRAEAVRYAQTVNQQNQQQAQLIAHGEARLVEQIKSRAALAIEAASEKYKKAYDEGNTDAIIKAQKELTLSQAEQIEAYNYEQDYNNRKQQWIAQQQFQQHQYAQQRQQQQYQQQQQPQQQQQQQEPTAESKSWADKNPWFGSDRYRDMTAMAYAEHERLVRDAHVKPDSDEYYDLIDEKVLHHFPEYFAKHGGNSASKNRPFTVVASGSRNNGGKPRTVRLEPHQVTLAKALGITPEQYARQVLKEQENI